MDEIKKPNIFFLLIDSFRVDKFYGKNKTSITPNLDSLIKKMDYL
jgi:predicted AlkP superfamily pyrophosphatase or phosphodiesterase